jgi:hypothetical protein
MGVTLKVFGKLAGDDKTKLTVRGLDPEAFKAYKSGPNGIIRVSDVVFIDPGEKATLDVTNVETIVFECNPAHDVGVNTPPRRKFLKSDDVSATVPLLQRIEVANQCCVPPWAQCMWSLGSEKERPVVLHIEENAIVTIEDFAFEAFHVPEEPPSDPVRLPGVLSIEIGAGAHVKVGSGGFYRARVFTISFLSPKSTMTLSSRAFLKAAFQR